MYLHYSTHQNDCGTLQAPEINGFAPNDMACDSASQLIRTAVRNIGSHADI